ncbi:AsmA family protein [Ketobacter sp.]|uniref:AsmA family protein n=1 Tax=Ketobacter sp. TaxID=2083498 RepID=UPI000F21FA70|nr:AsmA family protein [Ketobacter sp.]RLT95359.1 MAG: AsmA family protein [Ketobacter sp.]
MRVLKWIGLALVGLLVLILLAVLVIRFVIDPNDYKDRISALVKEASGYELTLNGDLAWSFYPVLGFESNQVTVAARANQPFLQVQTLALGVQLLPLFSGQLNVDLLQIDGVDVNLQVDAQGRNNWTVATPTQTESTPAAAASATTPAEPSSSPGKIPQLSIPLVRILNANIHYQDQQGQTDTRVLIQRLELTQVQLTQVQLTQPIGILLEFALAQAGGPQLDLMLRGQLQPDLDKQLFRLEPLQVQADVSNLLPDTVRVTLEAQAWVDLAADQAQLILNRLQLAELILQGSVEVTALTADPRYQGKLSAAPVPLAKLLATLGVELPKPASPDVLKTMAMQLAFNGNTGQLAVPNLKLTLDQSTLSGSLAVKDFATQALAFDLSLDQINLDDYLPAPDSAPATAAPANRSGGAAEESDLIPVDALRSLNLDGRFNAGRITLQQTLIERLQLAVTARNGVLTVKDLSAALLEGSLDGALSIDARGGQPVLDSDLKVNDIELTQITSRFMTDSLLSGKASLVMDAKAQGNSVDALLKSALGQMNLKLDDGVLHGINLNAIVVDALRDQLATVESLYPNYQEKLPRQLREDTEISKLLADAKVENGHLIMPRFEFFTGESGIDASGKIDLLNQGFEYDFGVVLSAIERNKYLQGSRWPIHCEGALASSPADWCRPDTKAMGSILTKAAKNAFKDKGAAELGDKVGLEAEDQAQLKQEVKQKLEREEDRAKKKLQEKLDKWLQQ